MESLLKEYPNILVLRVRMPIVENLLYERNFITKIIRYEKVCCRLLLLFCCPFCLSLLAGCCRPQKHLNCTLVPRCFVVCTMHSSCSCSRCCTWLQVVNIPNSMTVLPELLPYSIEMVRTLACTGHVASACAQHLSAQQSFSVIQAGTREACCTQMSSSGEGTQLLFRESRLHQTSHTC